MRWLFFLLSGFGAGATCNSDLMPPARVELARIARESNVPAFFKPTPHGPLPVILVNEQTLRPLRSFLGRSIGTQILLQPNTRFGDHGMLRIADWQIDWGMPETRGYHRGDPAEIHASGIAWRTVSWRLHENALRNSYSRVTVEVAFSVSSAQREDLEYYHRVRRAALFGVKQFNPRGEARPEIPNLLSVEESCFDFCMGNHLPRLEKKLAQLLARYPVDLQSAETRQFLKKIRQFVLDADPSSAKTFHPGMLAGDRAIRTRARALFNVPAVELQNFLNLLAAHHAVTLAKFVTSDLGLTQDPAAKVSFDNPKVAGILIYDSPEQSVRFRAATYTAPGVFEGTGWGEDAFGTIPFADQYPFR